ncbi:methyltransferase [Lithospermum erythrorhizon]|uniref:Methyltransferase n=1 Tax=Lithospermum erythrorhizon TaxID=34254 RepID=A0AAV3RL71_LITER
MASSKEEEAKLVLFLQWLQINEVELRGCNIKYSDSIKGFGIFSSENAPNGVLLVVPLDLAITPMRVLQDPLLGPECRAMLEEGEVDDRFLIILYLTLERLRKNSTWTPYLDMLPTKFGTPIWFSEDELLELKGTSLYRATELQKKSLQRLYEDKVKKLVEKLLTLDDDTEREVSFEDFLWANSIFWTRALTIPYPHSSMPNIAQAEGSSTGLVSGTNSEETDYSCCDISINCDDARKLSADSHHPGVSSTSDQVETTWVEGLVPGIDFCNHGLKPAATWEVDGTGSATGVPFSMYLLSAGHGAFSSGKEISISYGNKGNEELLYLYGFVMEHNPDDYLMIHYPIEAIENTPCSGSKVLLLEVQKVEFRCLLTKSLLDRGFFPPSVTEEDTKFPGNRLCNYSWSGERKMPSYLDKLVFPEEFMSALRTIAMTEDQTYQVSALLEELVGSEGGRQPSDAEVRAAIWEACGDSGALQMLIDLLNTKVMDLEEGTGSEESDAELLQKASCSEMIEKDQSKPETFCINPSRNQISSIIYRKGQKELARLFLKEAEYALELALSDGN